MFLAIDNAKAVLPIPGLAATIIKSLGCQPDVNLSSFSNPVDIPLREPSLFPIKKLKILRKKLNGDHKLEIMYYTHIKL
jgi:hypothetical protein